MGFGQAGIENQIYENKHLSKQGDFLPKSIFYSYLAKNIFWYLLNGATWIAKKISEFLFVKAHTNRWMLDIRIDEM